MDLYLKQYIYICTKCSSWTVRFGKLLRMHLKNYVLPLYSRISGSHSSVHEEFPLMGYNAAWYIENRTVFRRIVSLPSLFCACYFLHAGSLLVSSNLKIEVMYFCETLDDLQQATQHHVPEDRILAIHCSSSQQLSDICIFSNLCIVACVTHYLYYMCVSQLCQYMHWFSKPQWAKHHIF